MRNFIRKANPLFRVDLLILLFLFLEHAFAGSVTKEAAACNKEGIDAFFPILRNICTLAEAMDSATAKANMTATAEQVFRLL